MAYVRTRLGRWFFEERGARRAPGDATILLLHSLLCDGGMWRGQAGPLAALGRVLVFDSPGHGRSDVPPPFTLEDNAAALDDVCRVLDVPRAILVGLSWGGMIGMRAALLWPARVRALALLDTSAEEVPRVERVKHRAMVSLARRYGLPPWLVRTQIAPLMFAPRTLRERPELAHELGRAVNGYPREGTARATLAVAIHRKNIVDRLGAISAPTLVLCGREDRATPPDRSRTIAAHIPGARLEWIDDAGHLSAVEQPERVNDILVPFVREHLGSRQA
jgi:pimeloyl-ACP methyl ester carboxylesterase